MLHDVIEEPTSTPPTLVQHFGARVAALVAAVSEPPGGGTYPERKARLREAIAEADGDAAAVFAADKIAKVREPRMERVRDPEQIDDAGSSTTGRAWGARVPAR